MKYFLGIATVGVLVAALFLVHLAKTSSRSSSSPALAPPSPANIVVMQRSAPVVGPITVQVGQPIPPGLPPWTKPLATLRAPPAPEGTRVPVVPKLE